jgi:3-deoxy-7-phosphoheptulonate synthase
LSELQYGISVTDACIDWDTTESSMRDLANKLQDRLVKRKRLR